MSDGPAGSVAPPVLTAAVPRGRLVRARVATDFADPLSAALADDLTGYLRIEPGETLLGGDDAAAAITLDAGVPVLAYDAGDDAGGPGALAALAGAEPVRVESRRLPASALAGLHDHDDDDAPAVEPFRVAPDAPARELADDDALAERTMAAAPDDRPTAVGDHDALAAFLADDERVEAIRTEARAEAKRRATEWGLTDHLADE
ncbi:hypothetical protein Hbl1158_03105 [Halobaculum sp. CBA1158]|uniref:hypothetical protein n=1 Tax=Halobaculum sp. CBA1158 TaxID=2904243 RepID=UPI001F3D1F5B|nr:hypothetical protein [Halobaculum sp. CBA1158]UIP00374.1 hypothetical protein Hbl1158_03105 [Halobaculum sp. CBA1158]